MNMPTYKVRDPSLITPPRWEGEIRWEDLDLVVRGELLPTPEFVRRIAFDLLKKNNRKKFKELYE
jgi:hypothetical protein